MAAALKRRAERYQQGRDLRTRVPREAHAKLHGPLDRDAVAILAESDAERYLRLPNYTRNLESFGFGAAERANASMVAAIEHAMDEATSQRVTIRVPPAFGEAARIHLPRLGADRRRGRRL